MEEEGTRKETSDRICAAKLHDIVSEEEMQPFLQGAFAIGETIEFKRPAVLPAGKTGFIPIPPPLFFKLTEHGWERVPGKRPGILTPIAAWIIGGFIIWRKFGLYMPGGSQSQGDDNDIMMVILGGGLFVGGLALWWSDWQQYKKSLD